MHNHAFAASMVSAINLFILEKVAELHTDLVYRVRVRCVRKKCKQASSLSNLQTSFAYVTDGFVVGQGWVLSFHITHNGGPRFANTKQRTKCFYGLTNSRHFERPMKECASYFVICHLLILTPMGSNHFFFVPAIHTQKYADKTRLGYIKQSVVS